MKHGKVDPTAVQLMAELLAALGLVRLRRALELRRPPRWAARVLRLLPVRFRNDLCDSNSEYCLLCRAVLRGHEI
eukprot:6087647-Pyramimonas_sp.AAC.1